MKYKIDLTENSSKKIITIEVEVYYRVAEGDERED